MKPFNSFTYETDTISAAKQIKKDNIFIIQLSIVLYAIIVFTHVVRIVGTTLGKYDQEGCGNKSALFNPFDLLFKKITKL